MWQVWVWKNGKEKQYLLETFEEVMEKVSKEIKEGNPVRVIPA